MKKLLIFAFFAVSVSQACQTLKSQTYIDPQKSFVLGEGKHGSYVAQIQNVGKGDLEVVQVSEKGIRTSLGVLKSKEKGKYQVSNNTTVQFKNDDAREKGIIDIRLVGDTNLSMGYQGNNP
ncbi:MAG: hypothetical protein HUU01_23960 [Saprospiraceae bacterium]|nr:hypothetical protein [Saprospiraceae bacterium]